MTVGLFEGKVFSCCKEKPLLLSPFIRPGTCALSSPRVVLPVLQISGSGCQPAAVHRVTLMPPTGFLALTDSCEG